MRRNPALVLLLCAALAACSFDPIDFDLDGFLATKATTTDRGAFTLGVPTRGGFLGDEDPTETPCMFGCDRVRAARVVGSIETIVASPTSLTGAVTVASTNESVLGVDFERFETCCKVAEGVPSCAPTRNTCDGATERGYAMTVRARSPGAARLVFRGADRREVDSVTLIVVAAARVDFLVDARPSATWRPLADGEPLVLEEDASLRYAIVSRAANGATLRAPGIVGATSADHAVAALRDLGAFFAAASPGASGSSWGEVVGRAPGHTTLTLFGGRIVDVNVSATQHD